VEALAWFEANKNKSLGRAGWSRGLVAGFVVWQQGEKEITASEALADVSLPQATGPLLRRTAANSYLKSPPAIQTPALAPGLIVGRGSYLLTANTRCAVRSLQSSRTNIRQSVHGEAQLGMAACYDALGKTNEAVTAYEDLVHRHPNENVIPQASSPWPAYTGARQVRTGSQLFRGGGAPRACRASLSEAGMRLRNEAETPEFVSRPACRCHTQQPSDSGRSRSTPGIRAMPPRQNRSGQAEKP